MRVLYACCIILLLNVPTAKATGEPQNAKLLNRGLSLTELMPGDEETVNLGGGESLSVCGGANQRIAPHCMQYDYQSTYLLETFVLDREVYQAITEESAPLNDKEMVRGSQCLAEECTKRVQLEEGTWCLILTNVDEEQRPTNVTFHYQACLSDSDKNSVILVLLAIVGGLFLLLCLSACICCCICASKRKKKKQDDGGVTATVQYHPEMGWYMPPNPQDVYATPEMYMQQQYVQQQQQPAAYQPL